ncbi:MAG: N-6 DNA methylase, partial [Prevotella sp.]|nr:N-6 DNA methylase [Prevotella sp.]
RTKLLSCQVFAFREIYNEKLFMQNGKVLVEMVELFQNYRLSYSSREQFLGELFEQLLSHGFKQDEGQFFTPIPIARFIWNSIPFEKFVKYKTETFPKVIDYACGAGHFLTEGVSAISDYIAPLEQHVPEKERKTAEIVSKSFYGVEKDNRLARVSKIALLLNGANDAHIKAMDGLDHDYSFLGDLNSFDILVANPPYSVDFFKLHLERKLLHNYEILKCMPSSSDDIEYVFVERICQLLKPGGIAAVILPNWILITEDTPTMRVREIILKNFNIVCIASFGGKTFGKTPTPTFVMFLEKKGTLPQKSDLIHDSVNAIFENKSLKDWDDEEIRNSYLNMIGISLDEFLLFINKSASFDELKSVPYFKQYIDSFHRDTAIINLKESKSFKALSPKEQMKQLSSKFYEKFFELEKEKLYYFALTSRQDILLINPPTETDLQKKYLGYSFVNRNKKDVLIESEGLLSDIHDRNNPEKLSWVIKEFFNKRYNPNESLSQYVTSTKLYNLLNFSRDKFYKTISLSLVKPITSQYPLMRLDNEDLFTLQIGNRVLNSELVENGKIPVYSANVREIFGFVNKQNLTEFEKPSVLWGIDGDWLVNYIPANTVFYPTDHCGVLRVNSKEINPYYVCMAMNIVGKVNHFSRSFRASIERVKGMELPIPPLKIQDKVAKECSLVDMEYNSSRMSMEEYRKKIEDVFKKNRIIADDLC